MAINLKKRGDFLLGFYFKLDTVHTFLCFYRKLCLFSLKYCFTSLYSSKKEQKGEEVLLTKYICFIGKQLLHDTNSLFKNIFNIQRLAWPHLGSSMKHCQLTFVEVIHQKTLFLFNFWWLDSEWSKITKIWFWISSIFEKLSFSWLKHKFLPKID